MQICSFTEDSIQGATGSSETSVVCANSIRCITQKAVQWIMLDNVRFLFVRKTNINFFAQHLSGRYLLYTAVWDVACQSRGKAWHKKEAVCVCYELRDRYLVLKVTNNLT
jgi:hypothetical protein